MMRVPRLACLIAAAVVSGLIAIAPPAVAQQQPPATSRPLGAMVATSSESFGRGFAIRVLGDGRVLVNDPTNRRLVVLDAKLERGTVVADTTSATGKAYGSGLAWMVPLTGDSTLVLDQITDAFLVVDPAGRVARIIPRPANADRIMGRTTGPPAGFDHAGHLVYHQAPPIYLGLLDPEFVGDTLMRGPDSTAIVRVDIVTRRFDTLALVQASKARQAVTRRGPGLGGSGRPAINPIPSGDDWTVLGDGSVAVVRVRDYHVDVITPGKRMTSGAKIPTEWVRITDAMKTAIMDSLRPRDSMSGRDGGPTPARLMFVDPSDLPDYRPPFAIGFTKSDAEGNVWARVSQIAGRGGAAGYDVYDVIGRNGERVDRVQVPTGMSLAGFGPGLVYLATNTGGMPHLAVARFR